MHEYPPCVGPLGHTPKKTPTAILGALQLPHPKPITSAPPQIRSLGRVFPDEYKGAKQTSRTANKASMLKALTQKLRKMLNRRAMRKFERYAKQFERYTDRTRKLMVIANSFAHRMEALEIWPQQMLLAMACDEMDTGVGKSLLIYRQINLANLCDRLGGNKLKEPLPPPLRRLPMRPQAKKLVHRAIQESQMLGDDYVGTEHLLLAMVSIEGTRQILQETGATHTTLMAYLYLMRARVTNTADAFLTAIAKVEASMPADEFDPEVMNAVAWLLATEQQIRDGPKSLALAQRVCAANNFQVAYHLDTLAAAYAANGNFAEATRFQERALELDANVPYRNDRLINYRKGIL